MKSSASPHSSFQLYTPKVARIIEPWIIAQLFWQRKLIVINDKGEINFSHQGMSYSYQLFEPKLFFIHKNSRVVIHYSIEEPDAAYLFTEDNYSFIGEVNIRPIWTKDQPEIRHKHIGHVNKIHAYIKRQRMLDRIASDSVTSADIQTRLGNLSRRLNKKIAQALIQTNSEDGKNEQNYYEH